MQLSPAKLAALKTHINANAATIDLAGVQTPINATPNNGDVNIEVAAWYNGLNAPDFWVWKTSLTKQECVIAAGPEGTTFTWAGNGFITRSVQELLCWQELFDTGCNPSAQKVRDAFADIFSGAGNAALNRAHLLAVGRRKTTRGEKLFAVGTGSTASPAQMNGAEGLLTGDNVSAARNLP